MLKHRVIPCLLMLDDGLVKTTRFAKPKYVGDPINAIRIFSDKEVDELMVLDIGASRQGREPNYGLIEQFAGECFMPLCYGGGVSTVEQAQRLFALGVEKVCIQTTALRDMGLIRRIADRFGSQSVLFSLDVRRGMLGGRRVRSVPGTPSVSRPWRTVIDDAVRHGAGEIVLNAVDRDGTMKGMDLELISEACKGLPVPLVAIGGVGSLADIRQAVDAGASAVGVGAWFVFYGPHRAVLITYPRYDELVALLEA
jgi:cyclase